MGKSKNLIVIGAGVPEELMGKITALLPEGMEVVVIDIDALKQENFKLSEVIDALKKNITEKDGLIEQQMQTISELEAKTDTSVFESTIEGLQDLVREKEQLIESLMDTQKGHEAGRKEGVPVIQHKNKSYKLTISRFEFRGKLVTEDILRADSKLVDELLKIGTGALKLID